MQLHQSLQVAHLGVGLGGVAVVLQLGEVERALGQGFALGLVQLAGDADEPARGGERSDGRGGKQAAGKRQKLRMQQCIFDPRVQLAVSSNCRHSGRPLDRQVKPSQWETDTTTRWFSNDLLAQRYTHTIVFVNSCVSISPRMVQNRKKKS